MVPEETHSAMVPPQPSSESSGCGVNTNARSGLANLVKLLMIYLKKSNGNYSGFADRKIKNYFAKIKNSFH